jgi:hypothetical protein
MMPKIPFAVSLPSLVTLQARAKTQRPRASPEFIHAVAILAQCVYEDYAQWLETRNYGPTKPANPNEFHPTDVVGMARAYLNVDAEFDK